MMTPVYPSLYQINTRVCMTELSRTIGRPATLDDIPDACLDRLAEMGFDYIWFLSIWQTGPAGCNVSRTQPSWRREFEETLPDLTEADIAGSGFAVTGYTVHKNLGGDTVLAGLRERLHQRGLKLILDFIPNHTALDHPWVHNHPDFYVTGTEQSLIWEPKNYIRIEHPEMERIFAHGRDPFFPGWPDTLQLNYGNLSLQEAMIGQLLKIAGQCDGVRCDMAMLVLPDVFERTWGIPSRPFWPEATARVREMFPDFIFMAEVYWDMEWPLQQQGFDFTYDKRLYDCLREEHARPVREHLMAGEDYQNKMARFLENHDEPRAAAVFTPEVHEAAAVITFLSTGLRFFHQGQFEGHTRRISPHLVRGPEEPVNERLMQFYDRLFGVLRHPVVRNGRWQLLDCVAAWEGNGSVDAFVVFAWEDDCGDRMLVAVNYADHQSQCFVRIPFSDIGGFWWRFRDLLSDACYDRDGWDLQRRGLYLDMAPWQYHAFFVRKL